MWLRSLLFVGQIYLMMALLGLVFLPWALFSSRGASYACKTYCVWVRWTARWMVGLHSEVRGPVPQGNVLVAAKHQSFFDIILLFGALPRARFIMKRELMWFPVIGQYALRLGCIPVDRGRRAEAIRKLITDVSKGAEKPGQLAIYPQGTRVAPGAHVTYKVGTAVLYNQFGQKCVPVATNVGVFWPRKGILRKPGLAVIEFLPTIGAGLNNADFMKRLETDIEAASDQLMAEAGFDAKD
jgi:1-acyl-sn-glycerol-3-phosphate acyltransferase